MMAQRRNFKTRTFIFFLTTTFLLGCSNFILDAQESAGIRGVVTDASDAVIPGATVLVRSGSGAVLETTSDGFGAFSMQLAPGRYDLEVIMRGFERVTRPGIEVGSGILTLDIQLPIATQRETTSVTVEPVGVETTSSELGQTIDSTTMTAVPLNGRSYTDLLAIQAGVVPQSSQQPNAVVMSGCTTTPPSGDLDTGNLSISGQRETNNGFAVNGSIVEEDFNNGTAIVPNLDSIQDFKLLTGSFDAEHGNFSGGQVLVTTKSGSNAVHGSAFEFLRATGLDARNYFGTSRARYDRSQFGGTFGGPIRKDKSYYFFDFQGTQMTQGQETGDIVVPSAADRSGNVADLASQLTGAVSTDFWAAQLSAKLNQTVTAGEPYYSAGCTSSSQCVFPGAIIPSSIWSAPARNLLAYIPQANINENIFSTSSQNETLGDYKGAGRFDTGTSLGNLAAYYFIDQYDLNNPYPTAQGGANVPGFNAISNGRAQLFSVSLTKAYGARTLNEAHFSYMRDFNIIGQPAGGVGPSLASQGFVTGAGTLGIVPLNPRVEGIENVAFNDFTIGVDVTGERQINNTFQWGDSLSRVIGRHTLKLGGSFHRDQVNILSNSINNGSFVFQGTETGSDFADFLLGVASTYEQGDAGPFYIRNQYIGAFGQDSWQARTNFVVNYGLRWDVLPPWHEKYNQIQTFVLGEQSRVYPGAPTGMVFPGDPGIASTLSPTKWNNFAPRLGFSYSPNIDDGLLQKLFGGAGKSSIHAGIGIFYSAFEGLSAGIMSANAPYGYDYDSTSGEPLLTEPFVSATTGLTNGQPFPSPVPKFGASAAHPNTTVNWSNYLPITGDPAFYYRNTSPYTESYNVAWEREVAPKTFLELSYVGSQAHHLLVLTSANPGEAAICLSVSRPDQVAPGSPTCGPFAEGGVFTRANGTAVLARGPFGADFDGITYQKTIGFSNFNALEATLRHTSKSLEVMAAYTYGKSLDDSSSLSEPVYPMGAALSKALSAFDLRQNFVVSYRYALPLDRLTQNRWTSGWSVSGITRLSTGLPVTLYNNTDSSLLGSMPNGINNNGVDTPALTPGNLEINHNPRAVNTDGTPRLAFNTALFSVPTLGTLGNAPRRFFYGPGMENFDMSLQKEVLLREGKAFQLRAEAFNVFNHAQFFGASAVNGNISSLGFGQIVNAMPPREIQLAAKFIF